MFDYELDKTIDTGKPAAYTYFAGTPEFMNHQKMITKNDADDNRKTSRKSAVFKMSKQCAECFRRQLIADNNGRRPVSIKILV